ncbi:glycerophosphodiester phosphodiesterase [Pseudohaliea rubra]|uniref:glycerophosphodiester phosphodiesterase n=1 Tax=Pseudohaliea rubra TaxID=475795 RepID=UPI001EED7EF8|nr:glycerophosphodiester phosphodiesterase [Pseudohaliea rubra]
MAEPLVIAHRGASGYLPEHTLAAKALAHGQGADYLEQDVVLSADDVPIVLHDIHLDGTTNVAERFPDRARADGHWYAIDFTLAELRTLAVGERLGRDGAPVFPGRFPADRRLFQLPTLAEEIAFIDGLNGSSGRVAGLYIELKGDHFHRKEGKDLPAAVLQVLEDAGYHEADSPVFLQSFEPATLKRLAGEFRSPLPRIQLIAENAWGGVPDVDYETLTSDAGLAAIARYAAGIGPWLGQLYQGSDDAGEPRITDLAARAQAAGLLVHPYTFRSDALPPGIDSFDALLALFVDRLGVDGLFTDFPDKARHFLESKP